VTARDDDSSILRRHFIAVATDQFSDPTWPRLEGIGEEVRSVREWFCDQGLKERQFQPFKPDLSCRPSKALIRQSLEDPPASHRFRAGDAVVLYVTGHGIEHDNTHWIVLELTDSERVRATAIRTADLIGWLADTGLKNLLAIIDVCHAKGTQKATVQFDTDLPSGWIGLLAASDQARVGALTKVVRQFLDEAARSEKYGSAQEEHLHAEDFLGAISKGLQEQYGQRLHLFTAVPYGPSFCLPNPSYTPAADARVATTVARSDMAIRRDDLLAHWIPRARGVLRVDQPGWLFAGRQPLMRELLAFVQGPPGGLVVTGVAGSGKSAVLSRLVTLSDPTFRSEYHNEVERIPENLKPPEGAVDVAVLATGKTTQEVADQLCQALDVDPSGEQTGVSSVERALQALQVAFRALPGPTTMVVDALDEAQDPVGLLLTFLTQLNPASGQGKVRLLIGVRSPGRSQTDAQAGSGDAADTETRGGSLAELAVRMLSAREIRVDELPYWDDADLAAYASSVLLQPTPNGDPSPYLDHPDSAEQVSGVIARMVAPSFFAARIIAQSLAQRDRVQDPDDPSWRTLIDTGLRGVLRDELFRAFPDLQTRTRAVHLLRAVAFAYGRGLPWRDVWPRVATAVAGDGRIYGDIDIEWLLSQPLSGYLVRDLEGGVTVYRLFHESLREGLRDEPTEYLDGPGATA
jgi:hypothetical protein